MTVRELAERLGLSKTTVADALRGKSVVNVRTREWVQKKALEWGYEPNPVASAFLQQVRSKGSRRYRANLALLLPWEQSQGTLYQGALDRAKELGYNVDKIGRENYDTATLTRVLLARGVLGVAIGPLARMGHMTLDWSKFASVAMGYSMMRPALHRVVHNHLQGIRTALRMCRRKGFRRIGLALRTEGDNRSNGLWSAGFWSVQQKLAATERVRPFVVADALYTPERIGHWIRREKPEAVIFHTAALVPKLPEFAGGSSGAVFPVVLDRLPDDPYAGIDQRYADWGAMLIDLLSLQILHNERGVPARPTITMLDGVWVDQPV